jgi:GTPase SAR1 family protein
MSTISDSITSGRLTPTQVEEGNEGKIVDIDIETAGFEVADKKKMSITQLYYLAKI